MNPREKWLAHLERRNMAMFVMYYHSASPKSYQQVGTRFRVSRQRACQIVHAMWKKLNGNAPLPPTFRNHLNSISERPMSDNKKLPLPTFEGTPRYAIESGIPIPRAKTGPGSGQVLTDNFVNEYPFLRLRAGDSFFVPYGVSADSVARQKLRSRLSSYCSQAAEKAKKLGYTMKFSTRTLDDGVRVFCTKAE